MNNLRVIRTVLNYFFRTSVIAVIKSFSTYCWINKNPHLTLYYPLQSSIISVFLRFMGFFLIFNIILLLMICISSLLYDFNDEIEKINNNLSIIFAMVLSLVLLCLYYHIFYSIQHFVLEEENRREVLCESIRKYLTTYSSWFK